MASDRESLLALDSFATEESLRVAVIRRAMKLSILTLREQAAKEVIADSFIAFVSGQRWRLDVLDAALEYAGARTSLDRLMKSANEIAEWVRPDSTPEPEESESDLGDDPTPAVTTRKETTKKKP